MKFICSRFTLFLISFLSCFFALGQSPQGINYQAVLRDSESGEVLRNEMVFLIISIRDSGPTGNVVYEESHSGIATNDYGLINLVIGGGDATEGSFENIPWSTGNIWYELEVDYGSGLQNLGAAQFLSVPFALFAGNVEESLDNDPTNELIDSVAFNQGTQSITIQEGENEVSFSLDGLDVNDADADPSNELISTAEFDSQTNSIILNQGDGSTIAISLSDLDVDDGDSDPTNELISSAFYDSEINSIILTQADGSELTISLADLSVADDDADPNNELIEGLQLQGTNLIISEAGQNFSTNLDVLIEDADADSTNELIDESGFSLVNDTILTLTEAGIDHSVNLAPLKEDADWRIDEDDSEVFNESDKIGIGTSSPTARLEVTETSNSEVVLKVTSGTETMLEVANERIGVAATNPLSTVQFGGSVGYDIALLETDETDNYTADIDDHMIVVNFQNLSNLDFGIFLPPANVCRGRVYIIRKTGAFAAFGEIVIDTGSFDVDFFTPNLVLDEFSGETAVLLSLGNDGWTRILREN